MKLHFPLIANVFFYKVLSLHDPKSLHVNSCTICPSIMHSSAVTAAKGLFLYTVPHDRRAADAFPLVAQTGANSLPTKDKPVPATVVLERTAQLIAL